MSSQQHLASGYRADCDLYARDQVLNSAIIAADISRGWEEYLAILDAFYADHVEVTDGTEARNWKGTNSRTSFSNSWSHFM